MTRPVILLLLVVNLPLTGCTVLAIADTAATAVVGVGKVAVKGTLAVADAAIPDDDSDEDD